MALSFFLNPVLKTPFNISVLAFKSESQNAQKHE